MIKLPADKTLAEYGLSVEEWLEFLGVESVRASRILDGAECRICERTFDTFVVDHEHPKAVGKVSGKARWKAMPGEERKLYVRGVICRGCNYYVLTRQVKALEHRNAAIYLDEYEERRPR